MYDGHNLIRKIKAKNNIIKQGNRAMNATTIINDDMTLDQKLAAIDAAMAAAQAQANEEAAANGLTAAPLDPALLTICDGCE